MALVLLFFKSIAYPRFGLDRKIAKVSKLLKGKQTSSLVDWYLQKASLSLNNADYETAIDTLNTIYYSLKANGLSEEFIRLSLRIFDQIDWSIVCSQSSKFDDLWANSIKLMVELEKLEIADSFIEKYKSSIQGKNSQFINLCSTLCYRYWFYEDYEQAIFHGTQGLNIIRETGIEAEENCEHNLALAWREFGDIDNALQYFKGQAKLSEVLDPEVIDQHRNGAFYGNIGRCYFLNEDFEKAIICYKKSATLLQRDDNERMNMGYIRFWIGDLLNKMEHFEDAAIFLRAALIKWQNFSPRRFSSAHEILVKLINDNPSLRKVLEMPEWRLENRFLDWVRN